MKTLEKLQSFPSSSWGPGLLSGPEFKSPDAFLKIIQNEGIKSLWSGLPPALVMAVPATVIYFTCYDQLTALLRSKLGENESRIPVVAGIVARRLIPRLIKIAPACAVTISTYEFGKSFFQKQNAQRQQY
ncbi:hypothetical protein G4228_012211 [Cervus hanglu yarkandensis]|nr:hypothetical protein G4228_012211 [Cervus hanglu yarkandensis]